MSIQPEPKSWNRVLASSIYTDSSGYRYVVAVRDDGSIWSATLSSCASDVSIVNGQFGWRLVGQVPGCVLVDP